MTRYTTCLIGVLAFAACDDQMKSKEMRNTQSTDRVIAPTSAEVRAAGNRMDADNTGRNERDRDDSLTPVDQGNSPAEIAITASIRKDVMAESSLSFTAKNVKVVTIGNRVTLRGPVSTEAEKTLIEAVALHTTGVGHIDNQLEVTP
jgi:hyperosmotically inducible periplasmic protein